jgi:hypothetical protein
MRRALVFVVVAGCGGGGGDPDAGGDAGPPPDAYVDLAGPLFEPDHVVDISITLDAADWTALRATTRTIASVIEGDCLAGPRPSPFQTYEGSITIDGTTFSRVGIKKKGFFGSLDPVKPSLKIKIDEYDNQLEYLGLEKLTLNNSRQDPSYLRQCLAYQTFAKAGIVVPRCNFAHVRVNGENLGVYVNVESIDHRLMRKHYANGEGTLYEGSLSDFRDDWVNTFDPKGGGDGSDLQPLVDVLQTTGSATLESAIDAELDLEKFYTYWAMEMVLAHWDGYSNNKNNFFVYNDPTSGKLEFIPWGVDATFQPGSTFGGLGATDGPIAVAAAGYLAYRLFQIPASRDKFLQRERDMLAQHFDEAELGAEVDRMETLITPIADPHAGTGWHAGVDSVRDFIANRRSILTAALNAGPTWDAELDGYPCLSIAASFTGTFSTTWGTAGAANPFTTGSGTMTMTFPGGSPVTMTPVGATSGLDPNPAPGSQPAALIQAFGQRASDGHILVVSIAQAQSRFFPRIADVGFFDALAAAYDYNPGTGTATMVGFVLGTLTLDQGAMTTGAPVTGSYIGNADVQGTPPAKRTFQVTSLDELLQIAARTTRELAAAGPLFRK